MRKSIATVSLSGTLEDKLAAVAAARFDGIELFDSDLVVSDLSPSQVRWRCADLGLEIELFQPLRDVEGCLGAEFPSVLRRVRKKFALMEQLGAVVTLACSNVSAQAVNDVDLSAEQLSALGDVAADFGFLIAFEALAWGKCINRVGQAWEAVRRADHPNVGLAIDTFHMLSCGDGPEALSSIPAAKIAFLQIADAPRLDMNVLQWSRHYRCFPGQGNLPVAELVAAVIDAGYRGPLSLEVFSDLVRTAQPRMTALDAMRSLLYLEEELRALRNGSPPESRPQIELFDPPAVPARVDSGFVEFAVKEGDESLERVLRALGFAHVGTHNYRPVQWWRNGAANLCLTTLPVRPTNGLPAARPFASAMAVITEDVQDVATRASALLWPRVRYRRGPYESALPGLDSPDGLHVFVSAPDGAPDDWRAGYLPCRAGRNDFEHGDWLGIDHVGATVSPDSFPAEQSFYRTVFGLRPGTLSEFTMHSGRLRSRPLRPEVGDLRVILSVADGSSPGETTSGINHVAFECADVAAVVRRGRLAGVRFLDVPDNYYDDLDSRYDLAPELLSTLREHGLMYDRDERGALLHAYTETINGSFYLVLLQREGQFEGFGDSSTHVRLAAQARAETHRTSQADPTEVARSVS